MIREPQGAIIDLDGTIYLGNRLAPGAINAMEYLDKHDVSHIYLTNNGSRTPGQTADFLASLGAPIHESQIVTSSQLVAQYLLDASPLDTPVVCIGGSDGLTDAIVSAGFCLATPEELPGTDEWVLAIGWNSHLSFEILTPLLNHHLSLRRIVATDGDRAYPGEAGELLPGTAWAIGALERLLGLTATVCGKPNPRAFTLAAARLALPVERLAVIGDSLQSDAMPALAAGATAVLLSGPVNESELARDALPEGLRICTDVSHAVRSLFAR